MNSTVYSAFGLYLTSELALPELFRAPEDAQADIEIRYGHLLPLWQRGDANNRYYRSVDGISMLYIPEVGYFAVENGRRITLQPLDGATEDQLRLYVLGSCMGISLYHRRILPLHGSAVVIDGKAYAFVGDSGTGKSTLAAAFVQAGYPLLSDDVIAVSLSPEGIPMVAPAYPQQKLHRQSIEHLGVNADGCRIIVGEFSKFAVPVASSFSTESYPLGGLFELNPSEERTTIAIEPTPMLARFPIVRYHSYRSNIIPLLGLTQWHFETAAQVVSRIGFYQLYRPTAGFTAQRLVSEIAATIRE
jgi:hypothetical protein